MKKIYLIVFLSILFNTSCQDFLEEVPRDQMSSEQFFSEPTHAFDAVNSLYRNGAPQMYLSAGSYSGSRSMLGPYMTGFFQNEYEGQEPHVQHTTQLTLNENNVADYLGGIWADMYRGISRANNAIKYIPDVPGLAEDDARQLLAEARFFRAFAYFYLVRLFGDVPLVTEPYESLDNLYVERSPIASVYALIVDDLEFAVNEGNLSQSSMVNNGYRITEGAAATLLADVYLTMSGYPLQQNRYEESAAAARRVINSGTYSLTQHATDGSGNVIPENSAYNQIRRSDAVPNEYIYSIEYQTGISHSVYPVYTYPVALTSEVAYSVTNGAFLPRNVFLRGYDAENDLRVQEKQYFHSTFIDEDGSTINFATAPYMWHDDEALFETAASGKDLAAYTYSTVLLIAAESIARSEGVTPEAVSYLADVRSRAYWQTDRSEIESELSGLSVDAFVEEVWKERYRELVFEFHMWYDVQRTRKLPQTTAGADGEIYFVDVIGQNNHVGRPIQERHMLFPLPITERQRNPNLGEQNPGY